MISYRDELAPSGGQDERNRKARNSVISLQANIEGILPEKEILPEKQRLSVKDTALALLRLRNQRTIDERRDSASMKPKAENAITKNLSEVLEGELEEFTKMQEPSRQLAVHSLAPILETSETGSPISIDNGTRYPAIHPHRFEKNQKHGCGIPLPEGLVGNLEDEIVPEYESLVSVRSAIECQWDQGMTSNRCLEAGSLAESLKFDESSDIELDVNDGSKFTTDIMHGTEEEVKTQKARYQFLNREMIELFMREQTDEFIKAVDLGGKKWDNVGKMVQLNSWIVIFLRFASVKDRFNSHLSFTF